MGDITSKRLLVIKAILFVVLGTLAAAIVLVLCPDVRVALLLAIAVWAFCRAYYFAFYVVHHYIDPSYRFAGIGSAIAHLWRTRHDRDPQQRL